MLAPVIPLALFAYFAGSWHWWVWVLGVAAVLMLLLAPRRIDLDSHGITYVPLVPLRRTQNFRWSEIGPFERKTGWKYRNAPAAILTAPLVSGSSFCALWVFRSSNLTLSSSYGQSPFGGAMKADALLALVDSYRS
jgi:MFS family permease